MTLEHAELTKAIIGACFKVHNELGSGYSEKIYRRALAIVLRENGF
jgi:GxxExxY protein